MSASVRVGKVDESQRGMIGADDVLRLGENLVVVPEGIESQAGKVVILPKNWTGS